MEATTIYVDFTTDYSDELQAGYIELTRYNNGHLRVQLMTSEEPYAGLSINVDGVSLEKDEFVGKRYSENELVHDQFLKTGLFSDTGKRCCIGWALCPIYKIN